MGRNRLYNRGIASAYRGGRSTRDPYHCEWGAVVGDRVRRLRRDRDMTLYDLTRAVHKPEGGHYSPGYFSRLERGFANAPLHTYLAVADALDVDAGTLLGPDVASLDTTPRKRRCCGSCADSASPSTGRWSCWRERRQARSTPTSSSSPSMRVGSPDPSNDTEVASVSPDT